MLQSAQMQDLVIRIEYQSGVTDEDNSMRFRSSMLLVESSYLTFMHQKITRCGFMHSVRWRFITSNSSNVVYDNTISVKFDNWLLPENGVTICCSENLSVPLTTESQLQHS